MQEPREIEIARADRIGVDRDVPQPYRNRRRRQPHWADRGPDANVGVGHQRHMTGHDRKAGRTHGLGERVGFSVDGPGEHGRNRIGGFVQSTAVFHVSFYRFVAVGDPAALREQLMVMAAGLFGTILVAPEGVNGMLAGEADALDGFQHALQSSTVLGGAFAGIAFKRTGCDSPPFRRLKIKVRAELVPLAVDGTDVLSRAADVAASDVDGHEWRALLRRDDVIVLDNRNSFEYDHGHFVGAVDPGTADFRDFASYVRENAEQWRESGKTIAMYCTGGIRCEKSSPWMQDLGLTVRQLRGGIVTYLSDAPDADLDWTGDCFVFDNRRLLDVRLRPHPPAADQ